MIICKSLVSMNPSVPVKQNYVTKVRVNSDICFFCVAACYGQLGKKVALSPQGKPLVTQEYVVFQKVSRFQPCRVLYPQGGIISDSQLPSVFLPNKLSSPQV